jgi:hypothetical protein
MEIVRSRWLVLVAAIMLLLGGAGLAGAAGNSCQGVFAGQTLRGQFEATVRSGPDAGFSVSGRISMQVDESWSFRGTLTRPDGSQVPFSGQLSGREIRYHFDLGGGATIFGTGVLPDPCTDPVTGLLIGPNPPDRGDWGIVWGS